ncbi:hypothetical protein [Helcococcus ovis]|uniref:hypothetical protein n=1 Tax=Helcococcus ovis TaxID=72026 RepID=UPI0038BA963C
MKKLKLLSLVLAISVVFAGCQANKPKETIKETVTEKHDHKDDKKDDHKHDHKDDKKHDHKDDKKDDHKHDHKDDKKHDNKHDHKDMPTELKEEDIKSIEKHGDHYHIKTKDGSEFITHEDLTSMFPNIKVKEYKGDDHHDHDDKKAQ